MERRSERENVPYSRKSQYLKKVFVSVFVGGRATLVGTLSDICNERNMGLSSFSDLPKFAIGLNGGLFFGHSAN
jgi:hypothetical protein